MNRPEFGRFLSELDGDLRQTRAIRTDVGDAAIALIPVLRVHQDKLLAQSYLCCQHHESAVGAHRYCEGLFLKCPMVRAFSADYYRNIQQDPFTAPLTRLWSHASVLSRDAPIPLSREAGDSCVKKARWGSAGVTIQANRTASTQAHAFTLD